MSVPAADNLRYNADAILVPTKGRRLVSAMDMRAAADLLEAIDALHQMEPPAPWALSTPFERSYRCTCGRRWPCPTARLLHPPAIVAETQPNTQPRLPNTQVQP
jgi:hypothetical protein